MNPEVSAWRGRRVLVTGHTGFKGGWLAIWLQEMGAHVCGYSLTPPTDPSLFEAASVKEGMESIVGDIRDRQLLDSVVKNFSPSVVFHLAAQPLVRASYEDPVETYSTNVMGTLNVLESIRHNAPTVRAVVNITTDKCYENKEWCWGYRENEPMGGYDPYSSSKGCVELLSSAYRRSYWSDGKVGLATVRAGNVIGGGDWAKNRLVPDILRDLGAGRPVVVRNPQSIRPWQHVLEPLSAYLLLAERMLASAHAYADAWNIGPLEGDARTVGWIADKMVSMWGAGSSWVHMPDGGPHEAVQLKLDCAKAAAILGWRPRWRLEDALEASVAWHRTWVRGGNLRQVCVRQIREYLTTIGRSFA